MMSGGNEADVIKTVWQEEGVILLYCVVTALQMKATLPALTPIPGNKDRFLGWDRTEVSPDGYSMPGPAIPRLTALGAGPTSSAVRLDC